MTKFWPLLLLSTAACASAPPPLWYETRTYEVEVRPDGSWNDARAAAASVISRLDLATLSLALLRAETLDDPHGLLRTQTQSDRSSFMGFTLFDSRWSEKGDREARTMVMILDGPAGTPDRFRIQVIFDWWHPRGTRDSAYPRAMLDAIDKKLVEGIPAALEERGLSGRVTRITGP
jgi:hypothetical protein